MSLRIPNGVNQPQTSQRSNAPGLRINPNWDKADVPLQQERGVSLNTSKITGNNPDDTYAISIRTEAYNLQITHKAIALHNLSGPVRLARRNTL